MQIVGIFRGRLGERVWRLSALVALLVVFTIVAPNFASEENWLNTSTYATTTLLLACAELPVIITAGIDLSVGAVLGIGSALTAIVYLHMGGGGDAVAVAILASLAAGACFGALNGACITVLGLSPFITTLATLSVGTGIVYILTGSAELSVGGAIASTGTIVWFNWLALPVVVTVVVAVVVGYVLRYTRVGVHIYALGSNREAARRAGLTVRRHLLGVYIAAGAMAALAGFLEAARLSVATATSGQNDELDAIAAVIIGGASLFGGSGDVVGAVIGGVIVSVLEIGLVLLGANPAWETMAVGIVIVAAVFLQQGRAGLAEVRRRLNARVNVARAAASASSASGVKR
jgi:ribose transport system permease protein